MSAAEVTTSVAPGAGVELLPDTIMSRVTSSINADLTAAMRTYRMLRLSRTGCSFSCKWPPCHHRLLTGTLLAAGLTHDFSSASSSGQHVPGAVTRAVHRRA